MCGAPTPSGPSVSWWPACWPGSRSPTPGPPRSWSWWITLLNLLGSIAFGVSAVAGYISPVTGDLRNAERANLGTFVGAVCFLVGALLLLPERTETVSGQVPAPDQDGRGTLPPDSSSVASPGQ